MPVITAYTAAEQLAIMNRRTIVGDVVGDDLIITRGDSSWVNMGSVRGPAGDMGPRGIGALGTVAYAERTTEQTGIVATIVDVTGLTVTFTAEAGRRYRITVQTHIYSDTGGDMGQILLCDAANNIFCMNQQSLALNFGKLVHFSYTVIPGAGSKTYKVRAFRSNGFYNMIVSSSSQNASFIHAEDIGGF